MSGAIFVGEDIKRLIPQREPIVMVDALYEADARHAVTGLTVRAGNIFVESGEFTESGLIEHQAQSASVLVGYQAYRQGCPAPVGYIGEVKKCTIVRLPVVGDVLTTEITITSEVDSITLIKAVSRVGDDVVADCQMKIFVEE